MIVAMNWKIGCKRAPDSLVSCDDAHHLVVLGILIH
jgi:hypothetical protein